MINSTFPWELVFAWVRAAKNFLKNVYGFSKSSSFWTKKPNAFNVASNKLPALEGATCSKVVAENLFAVHDAKKAFIKSESDEKLSQALRHQVRTSSEVKHVTVDQVYYKRGPDDYCKGPATVTGQEN